MNRGMLRAEESLFSWALNIEGFLASLGMTNMGTFSANYLAAGGVDAQLPHRLLKAVLGFTEWDVPTRVLPSRRHAPRGAPR